MRWCGALARLVSLAVLTAALVPTASASAQEAQEGLRLAVTPFAGRGARAVQREVERALADRGTLVDSREAERAARDAGVQGTDAEGVTELATALDAALVVQGELGGSRRAPELTVVIRAADGRELTRGTLPYQARRGRDELARELRVLLDQATAALTPRERGEPEPLAPPVTMPVDDPEPTAPAPASDDSLAFLTVLAGVAVRTRDIDVQLAGGGTRRYASGAYPEVALSIEARPFAAERHLGRGLFFTAAFGHSVGLGSAVMGTDSRVETNFLRILAGAGWLAPLGDVVELGVRVSFAYDGYHLAPNVVLPTAEYFTVRPAVRGRIRFVQETLVLDVEAAYRGVFGVGPLANAFGEQAGAHGVDVGVGLGGNLLRALGLGFTWALRFDWVGYFLEFAGPAADAPATSATESALRVTALVGWSFR